VARAAFIQLDSATNQLLRDCFRQFNLEAVPLDDPARLHKEKFDAAVIWLGEAAEAYLKEARESRSNRRIVVFGICGGIGEAIRYSRYGINVLLEKPVDRQSALPAVRATHPLIINEFRRYVRIPIVVKIEGVCVFPAEKASNTCSVSHILPPSITGFPVFPCSACRESRQKSQIRAKALAQARSQPRKNCQ